MAVQCLLAAGVLVLLAAVAPACAVVYTVGDSSGWGVHVGYDTWASGKTFNVGDILVFSYGPWHNVREVDAADFTECFAGDGITPDTSGHKPIVLDKPGAHYFICGVPGHCASGMRLAVMVGDGGDADADDFVV